MVTTMIVPAVAAVAAAVAFLLMALRGFAALVHSAVFDSALPYNDPTSVLPSFPMAIMLVTLLLAALSLTMAVSPSTFTLRKGESATYQVTITSTSAPVGLWRFGSLTWSDTSGSYRAYSPIAVRAAAFSAPAATTGSGVSGSASFGVNFGYTGAYTAAAHGLVPATVTSDSVLQDVGQTFSPSDVGTGGAGCQR